MKTYQQFLTEELPDETITDFLKYIRVNCKPYIKESKGIFIYRGMKGISENVFLKKNIRTDRKPMSTASGLSNRIDDAFDKVFGLRARSAALFVSGNQLEIKQYGVPYIVFPIGNFQYIWSPKICDLYAAMQLMDNNVEQMDSTELSNWVKKNYKKNRGFLEAIKSTNEIMIFAKSYCGIKYDYYIKNK